MQPRLLRRLAAGLVLGSLAIPPFCLAGGHGDGAESPTVSVAYDLPGKKARRLKMSLALDTVGPEINAELKTSMPRIKHAILLMLSEMKEDELRSQSGKEILAKSLRRTINGVIREDDKTGVKTVLFTHFFIDSP